MHTIMCAGIQMPMLFGGKTLSPLQRIPLYSVPFLFALIGLTESYS